MSMLETIYTIPLNEKFDESASSPENGCPFCRLHEMLDANETDRILGAAMMEPDVRIKTNEEGFCSPHYKRMLTMKNRLALALMLESHLESVRKDIKDARIPIKGKGSAALSRISRLEGSCYICSRVSSSFSAMLENAVLLWEKDKQFRAKLKSQPYLCLPHYADLLERAKHTLSKKDYSVFADDAGAVVEKYFDSISQDVSRFCKKFDYRYADEPWENAKDAPERAVKFLGGEE